MFEGDALRGGMCTRMHYTQCTLKLRPVKLLFVIFGRLSYSFLEDRVRLVRLVSHGELPGERSGGSIIEYSWNNL